MKRFLVSALAVAISAATALASTEYVLVNDDAEVLEWDSSLTIGRPSTNLTATATNGYCGKYWNTVLGYQTDAAYSGTVYGTYILSVDTAGPKGGRIHSQTWVVGEDVTPGKTMHTWTEVPKSAGQTCTETINGVEKTFKKYMVTCPSCA